MTNVLRGIARLPVDYPVVFGVVLVCRAATWLAHRQLGAHPSRHDIDQLGYGLPSVLDGRLWTLLTGMVLTKALTPPLPLFSLIGVALYEHVAKHWRTIAVLVGGQVAGVLVICALLYPLRNVGNDWLHDMSQAIDFGLSVGGFATLGAWTAYLPARWRLGVRLAISLYFPIALVLDGAGQIYDLTHPAGWTAGLLLGPQLRERARCSSRSSS